MSLSYEDMNFIDETISKIRDFIGKVWIPSARKEGILDLFIKTLKEIRGGYNTHK